MREYKSKLHSNLRIFCLPCVVTVDSGLGLLENVLIFPSVVNAVVVPCWVSRVAHHIFLGHSAFGSDVCNTRWQIVKDLLDLADSWESFASTCFELAAFGSCWHGLVFTLEEQEGRGVIE